MKPVDSPSQLWTTPATTSVFFTRFKPQNDTATAKLLNMGGIMKWYRSAAIPNLSSCHTYHRLQG
jgi:hypothetical protein